MPVKKSKKPGVFLWLALPWLSIGALIAAYATGMDKFLSTLPYGFGRVSQANQGWGLGLVTFGCSARFAYLRMLEHERGTLFFLSGTIIWTILITLLQIFAICVIWGIGMVILSLVTWEAQ